MLAQVLQKAFGYLPFPAIALLVDSFDNIAAKLEARVYEKLKKITDKRVNPLLLRGSPGGDEGEEHYLTKLYVAWLYRDKLVETEKQLPNSQAVADVVINGHGLYYEVETLYGTGDPIKKLNDTVSKYRAVPQPSQSEIREVRIVIPNFVALLHLSKLLRFERYLEQQDKRFSIWTLDLSKDNALHEKGLRRLREVAAELRKLTKPSATL
jgi:hypothetical protein